MKWTRGFAVVLAFACLLGFAVVYGLACYVTLTTAPDVDPQQDGVAPFTTGFVYIGTGLAGLVAGIVAAYFGVQVPDPEIRGVGRRLRHLASRLREPREVLEKAYSAVYLVVGVVALVVFAVRAEDAIPDMIRNLALINFGLILAIARTVFTSRDD